MDNENYKVIPNTDGKYSVSDKGNVRNNWSGKQVAQFEYHNGYLGVVLYLNGKHLNRRIHRLVADAFLQRTSDAWQVNHKDENKKNNAVENLEWCTPNYNNNYGTRSERLSKAFSKPVEQYTLNGDYVRTFASLCEASKAIGTNDKGSGISKVCKGIRKTYKGYKWKYSI